MKRITTIAFVLLLAAVVSPRMSQAQKFGYIEFQDLMTQMPEYTKATKDMEAFGKQLQEEMKKMSTELEKKYDEYQKGEPKMNDAIKEYKQKELRDMQARLQEFQETAQENVRKKEQELLKPIVEKAKQAITDVAKAQGLTYVFDSSPGSPLLYKPEGDNLMAAVKKKLGIVPAPESTPGK